MCPLTGGRTLTKSASDIEFRLEDGYCTAGFLKKENRKYIEGFAGAGEQVTLIDSDYERTMEKVLYEA